MEISLLPKLKSSGDALKFEEWKAEFLALMDIVIKEDEMETKGLKLLKYAISTAKLSVIFDGNTTYNSA